MKLRLRRKRSVYERADVLGPAPGAEKKQPSPFIILDAPVQQGSKTARRQGVRFK